MKYMEDLKELLCAELEDYAEKGKKSGKLSLGDVGLIDTMLHSVKNIDKIEMLEEGGYSEDGGWEARGMYRDGGKDHMIEMAEELMENASGKEKETYRRIVSMLESV